MPDPTRPVADAPIATDWGQAVHDSVFTPKGVRVAGGTSSAVGTSFSQLQINTAVDDPAGWLAADALTVPAGAGGLYQWAISVSTDNGAATESTKVQVRVNGSSIGDIQIANEGTTAIFAATGGAEELAAGDVITVYARKSGGADPDVLIRSMSFIRRATELGA